jgi:hypothetical protein
MKLAQSVRWGAWIIVVLNLMMAFGSIWIFMRMAPAIEKIIEQNERSLHACEEMLASLALFDQSAQDAGRLRSEFSEALNRARNNITEKEEPMAIEAIGQHSAEAFEGNPEGKRKTVAAIQRLSQINRTAMVTADQKARQFGNAGAWGIVFMASAVFLVGMVVMRGLMRSLVNPLAEIHSVIQAFKSGDKMRRCTGPGLPRDIRFVFEEFNTILDQNTSHAISHKKWEN